jgi:quercetin dioxygenase-like cupin family protein
VKVDELGEISLAKEYPDIPGMKDYVMTNRRITLLPGQVTAVENSKVRPSYWYVVKGSPLENRSDREPSPLRPEEFAIEEGDVSFYWENPTAETVVLWMVGFEPRS